MDNKRYLVLCTQTFGDGSESSPYPIGIFGTIEEAQAETALHFHDMYRVSAPKWEGTVNRVAILRGTAPDGFTVYLWDLGQMQGD